MEINIQLLIDDARCYEMIRQMRWPEGEKCPHFGGSGVIKRGKDDAHPHRQRYE